MFLTERIALGVLGIAISQPEHLHDGRFERGRAGKERRSIFMRSDLCDRRDAGDDGLRQTRHDVGLGRAFDNIPNLRNHRNDR